MSSKSNIVNALDYVLPRKVLKALLIIVGRTPPPWTKEHKRPEWSIWRDCLKDASKYLEYGAGMSTLHALANYKLTVRSIETDSHWSRLVGAQAGDQAEIILVDLGPTGKLGRPIDYQRRDDFLGYCEAGFEGGFSPDFVLIDGRFRVATFLTALLKTRPGTRILFDDYVNRPKYHVVEEIISPMKVGSRQALFETPASLDIEATHQLRDSFLMVMD